MSVCVTAVKWLGQPQGMSIGSAPLGPPLGGRGWPRRTDAGFVATPKNDFQLTARSAAVAELRGNLCSRSRQFTHTGFGRLSLCGFGFVGVLKIFYAARQCQGFDRHDLCG